MKNIPINLIALLMMLVLAGCAHESTIAPSTGHIDNQQSKSANTAASIPKLVASTPYVPPPRAKAKEQTYSVVVNEVPVKEVLFALARESKLNIDIHPSIRGKVTLNAVDQTLPAILERLAKQVDLTYRLEGNVLNITPDQPVLRSYKVDYVNMSRDTVGSVGVASEIASAGQAASTGASGASGTTSSSSGNTTNSSKTLVSSESRNHFWATLIANIKDILAETDKEVIITRSGSAGQTPNSPVAATGATPASTTQPSSQVGNAADSAKQREEDRTEYKTLFAATVIANPEAGVISVRGTSKQHEKIQEFLDKIMVSAKRQVLIEATIVEVRLNDGYQAGIDWSRLATGTGFTFDQTFTPSVTSRPTNNITAGVGFVAGYVNAARNISASISLLKQFGDTKVLSSPKLMVLNNQTAVLKVVDNLVYFTVQSQISQATVAGGGNLQAITTTANTVPVGVVMSVTPQINDTGEVNINVRPTISSLIRYVQDPNPQIPIDINQGIPEIQVREMESMLQINSGNTAVLGGLMQDQIQRNTDKVPGLSDIPGIGRIFTARNDFNVKTELVIFLRPTVIKSASLESEELRSYKRFLPDAELEQSVPGNDYSDVK
jgi:MSHA biogenesis protein MshL